MMMRIIRGKSPFMPDKTHLHHLFFDFGFSHIGTTISIILLNLLVIISWGITFFSGGTIELQLYVVAFVSICVTFIFYPLMRKVERAKGKLYERLLLLGKATHVGHTNAFLKITSFLDKGC